MPTSPSSPTPRISLWFQELRTPELLMELARRYPTVCRRLARQRPLLAHAENGAANALERVLLAPIKTYGAEGKPDTFQSPLWYQRKPEKRATTNELINQLRWELWSATLKTNFTSFSPTTAPDQKGIKCDHPLESVVFLTIK